MCKQLAALLYFNERLSPLQWAQDLRLSIVWGLRMLELRKTEGLKGYGGTRPGKKHQLVTIHLGTSRKFLLKRVRGCMGNLKEILSRR